MLLPNLDLLATAPGGVARLRELILTLAVQGKLVPQDPADEPAGVLLKKIRAEKDRLTAEGKVKRDKLLAEIANEEKPFVVPQGWEWVKGRDMFSVIRGVTYQKADARDTPEGNYLPVLRANNIRRSINLDNLVYVPSALISDEQLLRAGDYVVCLASGSKNLVGKAAPFIESLACSFGAFCGAIRPIKNIAYFAVYLASPMYRDSVSEASAGIGINNLKHSSLLDLDLALPPLAEQARIVSRVEELMRLCDALEAKGQLEATQHAQLVSTLLGTLTASATPEELADHWQRVAQHFDLLLDRPEAIDALERTLLQLAVRGLLVPQDPTDEPAGTLLARIRAEKDRLIVEGKIKRDKPLPPIAKDEQPFGLPTGWEWARLDSIFQVITDGDHLPPPVSEAGIAFLTIGNISSGVLNFDGCRLVPQDYFDDIAEYRRPAKGDILYTVVGASYGRAVVVETDRSFCVQRHIGILKPSVQVNLQYLASLLGSQLIYEQATRSLTGTAQPTIGMRPLRNFLAPLPPLAEQSRIVARVTALRRLCADLRQRLKAAQITQSHLAQALVESSNAL